MATQINSAREQGGPRRRHPWLVRELGELIATGALAPGERLKGEIEASRALRVSRTAYREVLRDLAAKGLVISKTKTGTIVAPFEQWHIMDPDVLAWMSASSIRTEFTGSFQELCAILQPVVAALAASACPATQLEELRNSLREIVDPGLSPERRFRAKIAFNIALGRATRNPFLASIVKTIYSVMRRPLPAANETAAELRVTRSLYRRLFSAIVHENAQRAFRLTQKLEISPSRSPRVAPSRPVANILQTSSTVRELATTSKQLAHPSSKRYSLVSGLLLKEKLF